MHMLLALNLRCEAAPSRVITLWGKKSAHKLEAFKLLPVLTQWDGCGGRNEHLHCFHYEKDVENCIKFMRGFINLATTKKDCVFHTVSCKWKAGYHWHRMQKQTHNARCKRSFELVAVSESLHHSSFSPPSLSPPPVHPVASPPPPFVPSPLYFCLSSSVRLSCVSSCPLFRSRSISPCLSLCPPTHTLLPFQSLASQGSCSNSALILQPSSLPSLIPLYTLTGCTDIQRYSSVGLPYTDPHFTCCPLSSLFVSSCHLLIPSPHTHFTSNLFSLFLSRLYKLVPGWRGSQERLWREAKSLSQQGIKKTAAYPPSTLLSPPFSPSGINNWKSPLLCLHSVTGHFNTHRHSNIWQISHNTP